MHCSAAVRQFPALFCHAGQGALPYLWIVGYLAVSALIANVSVSTTEYSAALFAGQVGLFAVVLPYLFFTLLSLVIGSISSLTSNLCLARIDRNLRRMVVEKRSCICRCNSMRPTTPRSCSAASPPM